VRDKIRQTREGMSRVKGAPPKAEQK
jgi:hypothetical protein